MSQWLRHEGVCKKQFMSCDYMQSIWMNEEEIFVFGQHGHVVRSTDRGKTFAKLEGSPGTLTSIWREPGSGRFLGVSERTGVQESTNAGVTWIPAAPKSKAVRSLWGDATGHLMVTLDKPPGTAMRSIDGGRKWKKFTFDGIGSVVTGDGAGHVYLGATGYVLVSSDRGATFASKVPYPAPKEGWLTSGFALPTGHVWFVGYEGTIIHSSDFGAHWSLEPCATKGTLRAVWAADPERAFAVGKDGSEKEAIFERSPKGEWRKGDLEVEGTLKAITGIGGLLVVVGALFGAGPSVFVREG